MQAARDGLRALTFFRRFGAMRSLKYNLLGLTRPELAEFAAAVGESKFRGSQIYEWLYRKGATDFASMTDLGRGFRRRLEESATLGAVDLISRNRSQTDGTTKFLFGLADGLRIESVLIPSASEYADGGPPGEAKSPGRRRVTLCVSTQAGCPLGCVFCATGTMGLQRNLTPGEIVGQVLTAGQGSRQTITNVVFMGMGEPLMNYDNLLRAIEIIVDGIGIAARHITVSTAGWAEKLARLGSERRRVKLAVSLHSAVDATRSRLMPVGRKFSLRSLLTAIREYYAATGLRLTYEMIFFDGINDTDAEVDRLIKFTRQVPSKINVIPFHTIAFTHPRGLAASLSPSPRTAEIVERLRAEHVSVFVRSNAGEDIGAACGQLAVPVARYGHDRGFTGRAALRDHPIPSIARE